MGTLFSTFAIARSGMQAAQIQLEVAGHNIANVNREGYSRQRVDLGEVSPIILPYGQLGRGVRVVDIERLRDTFLDVVYRQQAPSESSAEIRAEYFSRIEDLFQEPGEQGFSRHINDFFDALNDFANNVEEIPVRMSVITEAENLSASLNQLSQSLFVLRTNANEEARNLVPQINNVTARIAELNKSIGESEANGTSSNDLRDTRDNLLDELSTYVNISCRERTDGKVDVMVGGEMIVNGITNRELVAVRDPSIDPDRGDLVEVRFADSGQALDVRDGQLYGALSVRDGVLVDVQDRLDTLASSLIQAINDIHSTGNGLENYSQPISGTNPVSDSTVPLTAAGLPFEITPGTFDVLVYTSGVPARTTITVTASTTLDSLVADLDAIADLDASIGPDGALLMSCTAGHNMSFANDKSGVLTALGVNGLFTGYSAATIGVNKDIITNPRLMTSTYNADPRNTGENHAALALANVRTAMLMENGSSTINDYYESTIVQLGVDSRSNLQLMDMQNALMEDYQRRRDEVSGVSIDEEVTNMLQFQRAYEASARVISAVNSLFDALLASVS